MASSDFSPLDAFNLALRRGSLHGDGQCLPVGVLATRAVTMFSIAGNQHRLPAGARARAKQTITILKTKLSTG
jgi:hypothetical protein